MASAALRPSTEGFMLRSRRLSHSILLLLPLLLALTQTACGGDTPEPSQDAGIQTPDAGRDDAGPSPDDAGTDDAGTDDAGTEPEDAGTDDAGTVPEDAGTDDAGTEPEDAGTGAEDGGSGPTDGGSGDAGTEPDDAGTDDAGTNDAGTDDAGTDDAGTGEEDGGSGPTDGGSEDGGTEPPECPFGPPDGGVSTPGDPTVVQDPTADILDRLRAIPGLTVAENPNGVTVPAGHRFFVMEYDQPADHARPECQRFKQRLVLLHRSVTAPVVFYTSGYYVSLTAGRRELTTLLAANQLSIEHRFFLPSRPEPADWSQLTIKQSADDFHRVAQAIKQIYSASWVSTGVSKGGETMVFYRRFHPEDVDATVAYVAPLVLGEDERFPDFQATVGGPELAWCREQIHTFQRAVLNRRQEMVALLRNYAVNQGLTYSQLGFERALEHAVIETYFAFWQYSIPQYCDAFPDDTASSEYMLDIIDWAVGLATFSDNSNSGIAPYYPYYYQASLELGWPKPYEAHLGSLIQHPGTNIAPVYSTPGVPVVFRPQAMQDIEDWLVTHGQRVMFIYGDLDPWTAAAFPLGNAQDSFVFTVPGGNHGSTINQLPTTLRAQAQDIVRRWAGVPSLKHAPVPLPEADTIEFGPHLPPRLQPPTAR
ncbi:multidrug transporter [Myxococcus xanthus]|uniref:Multidrug transporter n=1 Tax=Myxococcus xanthus TaxID=34 RepID=A0AAE6FY92_MYXXA|nr:multidrug transporter [Myxococcus xanthus]QDE74688.1 multidrug transporter [Myxococcus xanthus]